ncbi:MAG: hypothetical protein K9I29_05305 [Bacteroidales bacterium]|nr:hypothetical protein [Bacteroidales bacterium]MCF8327691.1 hypothetical protein [Bacteroidales bacterium]
MDYTDLREKLNKVHTWPTVYMFKFIVPDYPQKLARVQELFSAEAEVYYKSSRKGNYISVTGKEVVLGPDEIIRKYEKAEKINDLIAL